jgi:hypothetical protein
MEWRGLKAGLCLDYELFFDHVGFIKDLMKQCQLDLLRKVRILRQDEPSWCVKPLWALVSSSIGTRDIIWPIILKKVPVQLP